MAEIVFNEIDKIAYQRLPENLYAATSTNAASVHALFPVDLDVTPAAVVQGIFFGLIGRSTYKGTGGLTGAGHMVGALGWSRMKAPGQTVTAIYGLEGKVDNLFGTVTQAIGCEGQISEVGVGQSVGTFTGFNAQVANPGNLGTITNFIGLGVSAVGNAGGTITNYIGAQVAMAAGTVSNAFGVFITDLTASVLNAGVFCQVAEGLGKYGLLMDGTARNVLKGRTHCGADVDTGLFLGSEDGLALKDGITAPAQLAGYAKIYVDTADGDLKVKFADGVTKVIAADS